jgi:tol-pal system protein YbgF
MRKLAILAAVICCFALSACATGSATRMDIVESELAAEKQKRQALEAKIQELEEQKANVDLDSVRSAQATQFAEMEQIRRDVAMLKGQLETVDVWLNRLDTTTTANSQQLVQMKARMQAVIRALETQLAVDIPEIAAAPAGPGPRTPATPEEPAADQAGPETGALTPETAAPATAEPGVVPEPQTPEAPQTPEQPADTAQALYDRAMQAYNNGEYEFAQSMWAEFVEAYPEHELVPNALFWQGESFYKLERYDKAVLAYEEIIQRYPDAAKHPAALLKQGISWYKYGQDKAGNIILNRLMDQYPDTPEAKRAATFLDQQG